MRVSTFSVAALAATAVPCVAFAPGTVGVREHTSLEMTTVGDALKVNGGSTDPPSEGTTDGDGGGSISSIVLSSVTSLATAAGNREAVKGGDGFEAGAISSAFTGAEPVSQRSQLIKWQRENSKNARRATARLLSTGEAFVGDKKYRGKLTKLKALLPTSSEKKSKGGGEDVKGQSAITTALKTLEEDMTLLDDLASAEPQLSGTEAGLLVGAVVASGIGPILFPGTSVTEVLAPAAAAFSASITIGSEYIGRVAVADGKEIAANAIQCAAEAEALLANAERVKAISPLCVGLGATGVAFTLLTPTIIEALGISPAATFVTELYLLAPLVCVLSAAVANLALQESKGFANRAIRCGSRRFSKASNVGRAWLSMNEEVKKKSESGSNRWWVFAQSTLPAPIIGGVLGGHSLSAKCILVAALAAAQSAYYLAEAEGVIARAQDAVALKARSAAVCDTYANQGVRNSAILPFTSALSAFCAAATAAAVELPFIETITGLYGTIGEVAAVSTFPILSSAFAAAGAVSKARCEVDAEAAAQAASSLALEYDTDGDPVLRPFQEVWQLVKLALKSGLKGLRNPLTNFWRRGKSAFTGFRLSQQARDNNEGARVVEGEAAIA